MAGTNPDSIHRRRPRRHQRHLENQKMTIWEMYLRVGSSVITLVAVIVFVISFRSNNRTIKSQNATIGFLQQRLDHYRDRLDLYGDMLSTFINERVKQQCQTPPSTDP